MSVLIEIILTLFYTILFILLIYKLNFFSQSGLSKKLLTAIFVLKILTGIILAFIYTYYYNDRANSDIFKFFDDAKNVIYKLLYTRPLDYLRIVTGIDSNALHLNPVYDSMMCWYKGFNYNLYNENRTIIRLNAIVMIFSFGNYTVHTVFMSFLSLIGLTAIYKVFYNFFSNRKYELMIAVFFAPSIMIWTSCMLKEGLIIFALGLLIYCFNNILIEKKLKKWNFFIFLFSFALLLITKIYILLAIIPGLISIFWIHLTKTKILLKFIIVHFIFLILAFNSQLFIRNYDFVHIISRKQHDFVNFVNSLPHVGSKINIQELQPTWISFIKSSPIAFFNTFIRPTIFEAYSLLVALAAIENLVILLILVNCFVFIKKFKEINFSYFYFCLFFMLIIYTLSGLTTPVLGALVRYKTPALPFLLICFMYLTDFDKLYLTLHKLKMKNEISMQKYFEPTGND